MQLTRPPLLSSSATGSWRLLKGESQGAAIDFTVGTGLGSASVKDTTTTTNNKHNAPVDSFLTQSGTSPKLRNWVSGNFEWTGHNLLLRSETIGNVTAWADLSTGTTTVVATNIASPTGSLNAVQLIGNNANTYWGQSPSVIDATYTGAIWLRADAPVSITLRLALSGATDTTANLTTAWQQFTVTRTMPVAGTLQFMFNIGNGVNIYAWGAQLNRGTVPTAYHVTTAAAWYGVPIEYDPSTGKFYALVEPQATNLALQSSDFTNASWTKSNMTTALTATGPDGVANSASTLTATAGNATALQAITSGSASRITSMFVKRRTGTGNIDITQNNGTNWTTVTVTAAWTRVNLAAATATDPTVGVRIVTSGDAVDVAWFQHELTAVTSPIPSFATSVTRGGDGNGFAASVFPYSESAGTWWVEWQPYLLANTQELLAIGDADNPVLYLPSGTNISGFDGTSLVATANSANLNVINRTAVAWSGTTRSVVLNGSTVATGAYDGAWGATTFGLGYGRNFGAGVNSIRGRITRAYFVPNRKTDADLITRTAP